jgi:hypothetical protein
MAEAAKLVREATDAHRRLAELELDEAVLLKATKAGFAAWAAKTPNHPRIAGGFDSWSETVYSLREDLALRSWRNEEPKGMALVVSPSGDLAITSATGDAFTGCAEGTPKTKSDKGPMLQDAIEINARLLNRYLIPEQEQEAVAEIQRIEKQKSRATWVLLCFRDLAKQELRCELSLPLAVGKDLCIERWAERILLTATPFGDSGRVPVPGDGNPPQTPEITIKIERLS